MINFILATAMCHGCAILDNMDRSPECEVVVCTHSNAPSQMVWKSVAVDGMPENEESCLIIYKGHYAHALWIESLSMWYTPFFTEKKFIKESEVNYYSVIPSTE